MAASALLTTRTRSSSNRSACRLLASLCLTDRIVPTAQATVAFALVTTPTRQHQHQRCCVSIMAKGNKSKRSGGDDVGADSGVMMILSPAKTLDLTPFDIPSDTFPPSSKPSCDSAKTELVASAMKARSKKELEKLLGISANLAEKSHQYWTNFDTSSDLADNDNQKPAIYAFSGAAYQGLDITTCSEDAIRYMQSNLRIVDPLYGSLRPLDLMQPYRLEMATKKALDKTKMGDAKDLAAFWRPAVIASIGKDLEGRDDKLLLNLASDEYAAAVDGAALPDGTRYIKVVFQQEGRVIAVHAKKARGMMVRYLSENGIEDVDGIRNFAEEGYKFIDDKSTDDTIVFDRPKQAAQKKKKKPATNQKAKEEKFSARGKKAKTSR